ncbi:MAG: methionyl-tRNA formyltransferase [Variovorax sp.]
MKVIFAGTPAFAAVALAAIAAAGHDIVLVLTQPDRPAGRGLRLQPSPVKALAAQNGWPIAQPRSLRLDGKYPDDAAVAAEALRSAQADVMVVAAYGLILPQWVLDLPRLGCLNIHASLLPRWRGAAPIHRAVEAGDAETGITIMQMDAGLDTGDTLLRESLPIGRDNTATLHDRLADMGGRLVVEALRRAQAGTLEPVAQPAEGVTYAHKVEKHEAAIDWTQPAEAIVRRVRAFDPFPGAASQLEGDTIKLWAAHVQDGAAASDTPGTVVSVAPAGIAVAARDSIVVVTELQRAGGKRLAVADFLRGFDVKAGQVFGQ